MKTDRESLIKEIESAAGFIWYMIGTMDQANSFYYMDEKAAVRKYNHLMDIVESARKQEK